MIMSSHGREQRAVIGKGTRPSLKLCTGFKDNHVKPMQADQDYISAAITGDKIAIQQLIRTLTPVIQSAVAHVLLNHNYPAQNTDVRSDVADHSQNVFVELFKNDCRVLKRWDPEKGMSLNSFISLIAKRKVISSLRSEKYHCSIDDQAVNENIDRYLQTSNLEREMINRHFLLKVIRELKEEISELGYKVFVDIFLFEKKPADVAAAAGVTTSAIYVWCNRIKQKVQQISERLSEPKEYQRVDSQPNANKKSFLYLEGKNDE